MIACASSLQVDFASQESQMAFYRSMQASGQDIRDFYEIPSDRRYTVVARLLSNLGLMFLGMHRFDIRIGYRFRY